MKDRNAYIAGGFILVAVALVVAVILAVNGLGSLFGDQNTYTVVFKVSDDVGGLKGGSQVRVGGLQMGSVQGVEFANVTVDGQPRAVLAATFRLPARVTLGEGAAVAVQSTVTGSSWLNVSGLGDLDRPLGEDDLIDGDPNTLTQLLNSINQLALEVTGTFRDVRTRTLPRVNEVADNFATLATRVDADIAATAEPIRAAAADAQALAAELRQKLPPAVDEGRRLASAGADVMEQASGVLGEGQGAANIQGTLANLNESTATINDRLPGALDQIDGLLSDASAALTDVRRAAGQADSILADNRPRIDRIVTNAREASESFRLATSEIRRSPWRLLYRPDKSQSEQLDLYDSARRFAEGAQELSAAADALRVAANDPTAERQRIEELLARAEAKFRDFDAAERRLYEELREQ